MSKRPLFRLCTGLSASLVLMVASPLFAKNTASGQLIVAGKPVAITQAYAYAKKGFFDPAKNDVVILLCDAVVPPPAILDSFARGDLVKAGKLHCIEQTINAEKQVINFKVEHNGFGMPEGGGSTEQVFEATTFDGKTISGHAKTKSPQKSFDDVPYTYDIAVTAVIDPIK